MTFSPKIRWAIIGTALILTLAAINWVDQDDSINTAQASAVEVNAPVKSRPGATPPDAIHLEKLKRTSPDTEATAESGVQQEDPFKSKSWYVAPPPPKPLPPPAPTAPPLPFTYIGKLVEEGVVTVFIAKQDRNYVIKSGDVIDGTYRVDAVSPATLTLTYLPLNIKQSMPLGDSN